MKKDIKTSYGVFVNENGSCGLNLQSFINNTKVLMWSVNGSFKLLISNEPFDRTLGQILFKNAKKRQSNLAIQLHFISLYERAMSGKTFTALEYVEKPVEKWLEISYHPIHNGDEIIGVTCYAHDVSDMKNQIAHLRLIESVVTNATDAIFITEAKTLDSSGPKIVYVNNALLKMTGYSQEEVMGKTPDFLMGPKSDRKQLAYLRRCFRRSEACEIEILNYKKDGGEFWIHMAMVPVIDIAGLSSHFIGIGRDVTERLKNIASIKKQNTRLSEIARIQSHEVRGPVARIKGLINLLTNYPHTMDSACTHELLRYLRFSVSEMDDVIKKIIVNTDEIPVVD